MTKRPRTYPIRLWFRRGKPITIRALDWTIRTSVDIIGRRRRRSRRYVPGMKDLSFDIVATAPAALATRILRRTNDVDPVFINIDRKASGLAYCDIAVEIAHKVAGLKIAGMAAGPWTMPATRPPHYVRSKGRRR